MLPSEDRRWRRAMVGVVPCGFVMGTVASAQDWAVGWIWLAILAYGAIAVVYVHRERATEQEEREAYAREHGLAVPRPRRRHR